MIEHILNSQHNNKLNGNQELGDQMRFRSSKRSRVLNGSRLTYRPTATYQQRILLFKKPRFTLQWQSIKLST